MQSKPRVSPVQRAIQRLVALRPVTWLMSHVVHRIDKPFLKVSGGRYAPSALLAGLPVVTLTTTGAKSGLPRTLPVVGIEVGDRVVLVASNFGRETHPAWYFNLRAHPQATLVLRGRRAEYTAYEATGAERAALWRRALDVYPGFASYEARAGSRQIPIMVLTPTTPDTPTSLPGADC